MSEVHMCEACRSTDVRIMAWVDPQTGEVSDWFNSTEGRCEDCGGTWITYGEENQEEEDE